MRAWFLSGVVALALATTVAASPARADPPVWRVSDADTEMVLFGSVHSLPPGIEWRTTALDQALAGADLIVFEILTPGTEAEQMAMLMPMMPYLLGDRPLSQTVSAETFARVAAAATAQGGDPRMLDMFRPWAAALMLDMGADEALGRSGELGVDVQIETGVRADQRKQALDTDALLHASMAALAEAGDAEGEEMLVEVLDTLDRDTLDLEVETAWAAGDLEPILRQIAEMKVESPRLHQVLLIDRNTGWMPALEQMMQSERRVVVVAGAAHMVGDDGLPALLRRAGYAVEGP